VGHAVSLRNRSRTGRADGRELPDRPTLEHHAPLPDSRHRPAEGGIYGRLALTRSREAAAKSFEGMPGRRGENIRRSCEILPRFYGGSGSRQEEIHKALDYGVVKMNVDTDMQYAFTRAVAAQMFKNDERRAESGRRSRQQESL